MILIALKQPGESPDSEQRLARALLLTAYEARARLAGSGPPIVAVEADAGRAMALVAVLRLEGFRPFCVSRNDVASDGERDHVGSLSFEPDTLRATLRPPGERAVRYDEIMLLLRGVRASTSVTTSEETRTRFSAGKALLTGGLILSTKEKKDVVRAQRSSQSFLYVFTRDGGHALALYEQRVHYGFLGSAAQASSLTNFLTVVAEIRRRAPAARYDERLVRAPQLGAAPPPPPGYDADGWRVDLAAALLAAETRDS